MGWHLVGRAHVVGTDVVEPSAVPLVCVDVERYENHLTYLYVEALQTVGTEYGEDELTWILRVDGLYDELL